MRTGKVDERGLSLIEVMVATAILAVAIVVALTVYDASRKAFAKGENATEQQAGVRIAFDLMTSQIRMLGLNVNSQPVLIQQKQFHILQFKKMIQKHSVYTIYQPNKFIEMPNFQRVSCFMKVGVPRNRSKMPYIGLLWLPIKVSWRRRGRNSLRFMSGMYFRR